jgi:hypothetical protein
MSRDTYALARRVQAASPDDLLDALEGSRLPSMQPTHLSVFSDLLMHDLLPDVLPGGRWDPAEEPYVRPS